MIYCAWLVWNDLPTIRESIYSVQDYVDHFIVVDGAFLSNYHALESGKYKSTDGTDRRVHRILRGHNYTYVEPTDYWADEGTKRSAYCTAFMELAQEGDWLLWIDADEIITDNIFLGMKYLRERADYVPHWVWVKSTYPAESPHRPFKDKWDGYSNYYGYPEDTYFDLGKRINLLTYTEGLHYKEPLQPYNTAGRVTPPLPAYTMMYFMIWNQVWLRPKEALQQRLERSIVERSIKAPWAKKELEKYQHADL
jgi:hypothetical protein